MSGLAVRRRRAMARAEAVASRLAGDASRRAAALAVAVICLLLATRVAWAAASGGVGTVPWVAAAFVLPVLFPFPGPRRRLERYRWPVLAVQAVLTWVPFAIFGGRWAVGLPSLGLGGLLAALVLLTVRSRASWLAAGLLLAADVLVRALLGGLDQGPAWSTAVTVITTFVDDGLYLFVMIRLAQIVGAVEQAHRQAAELAAAAERLQAAQVLQAAVGQRLAGIAARAGAARQALAQDAAQARAQLAAAGVTARETVARARAVAADRGGLSLPEEQASTRGEAVIGARLAWAVLVVMLTAYTAQGLNLVVGDDDGAWRGAVLAFAYLLTVVLQVRHSGAARQGRRPRAWPFTLALQAALVYMFFLPPLVAYTTNAAFLAASVLLLVPGRWRWAGYAAVPASWAALYATVPLHGFTPHIQDTFYALYVGASIAMAGLVVYAMSLLAGLARELEGLRGEVARVAAVRERLRVARDVHDLLGLGLSAVALKADLVSALIGRDDTRAAAEIAEMSRICAASQADIRLVTGDGAPLSLAAELAAAEQILASAGITVSAGAPAERLPPAADEVLAPVLREAVTNVLRHSTAIRCVIEVTDGAGALRLRVGNDGGGAEVPVKAGEGHGLANMTARMRAAGGRLSYRQADGRFELTAEIPVPGARLDHAGLAGRGSLLPAWRRVRHPVVDGPLTPGHGADGADEVAGRPVLEQVPGHPGGQGGG
jgi:two-component system sensor histidine kinase DesK